MTGHLVDLAILFAQPQPPAFLLRVIVLDLKPDNGRDTGEGEGHDGDDGAIAQPDDGGSVHAVEQLAGLNRRDDGRCSLADGMTRSPNRVRRI